MSQDRVYDPAFAAGPKVTIMDTYRDHAGRQRYCGCPICGMARLVLIQQTRREAEEAQAVLTERLMKEWP